MLTIPPETSVNAWGETIINALPRFKDAGMTMFLVSNIPSKPMFGCAVGGCGCTDCVSWRAEVRRIAGKCCVICGEAWKAEGSDLCQRHLLLGRMLLSET